jgi:hypothetical protein
MYGNIHNDHGNGSEYVFVVSLFKLKQFDRNKRGCFSDDNNYLFGRGNGYDRLYGHSHSYDNRSNKYLYRNTAANVFTDCQLYAYFKPCLYKQ